MNITELIEELNKFTLEEIVRAYANDSGNPVNALVALQDAISQVFFASTVNMIQTHVNEISQHAFIQGHKCPVVDHHISRLRTIPMTLENMANEVAEAKKHIDEAVAGEFTE